MPEFQKKNIRFAHKGIQWNRSVDNIPEGQIAYGRNIRILEGDTIGTRPGLFQFAILSGVTHIHSIQRLNNFNAALVPASLAYVVGGDTSLYVGDTSVHLNNGGLNPVSLPGLSGGAPSTNSLSGNPLSIVDMSPVGGAFAWKYVGDTTQNLGVGYYPGQTTNSMAHAITMGMLPPVVPAGAGSVPAAVSSAGNLNGKYRWCYAYRNRYTGARSNPSAATRVTQAVPDLTCVNTGGSPTGQAFLHCPDTPIDPITGVHNLDILIDVYRFGGTINDWRYIGTADSPGATYTDNTPDADLITGTTPPETVDATTGVARFPLFQPFVTADNAVYSLTKGTVTKEATTNIWILTAAAAQIKPGWVAGSVISINNRAWTIYQVRSTTVIEVTEDLSGDLTSGSTYDWATLTGTLLAGTPMSHLWGPFSGGGGGAYLFGVGDKNNRGTLYWCNGNDPDSADIVNSIVVTGPSEPLQSGCVYDGSCFVWSSERLFRVYASSVAGQFTVEEVPGGKGMLCEYSLTVQSNGITDQSMSWVGKDGIYDYSNSAGMRSLTNRDMYALFNYDGQAGTAGLGLHIGNNTAGATLPFLNSSETVPPPHFETATIKYHRLSWFDGLLFYDYVGLDNSVNSYQTAVYDSKQCEGWVSFDKYFGLSTAPIMRSSEVDGNALMVAVAGTLYNYTGLIDNATNISCRVVTRQDDCGDLRGQKLYGDYMFDCEPGASAGVSVAPRVAYGVTTLTGGFVPPSPTGRSRTTMETSTTGLGILSPTFGLDITWVTIESLAVNQTQIFGYTFDWVPKPEITGLRALDKSDEGYNGAKYIRGFCIETNTFNVARKVNVLVDGVAIPDANNNTIFTVTANGQLELPYALTPTVGYLLQIAIDPTDTSTVGWEVFTVRWVWEKWPDLTLEFSPWMDLGTSKPKYIRGFEIPISAASGLATFYAAYDGGTQNVIPLGVSPVSATKKTPAAFAFLPPILAHQIQLNPTIPIRAWYDEIKWDAEEWPELLREYGPVDDLGTPGAKYLRGLELPIETGGNTVTISLLHDQQIGGSGTTGTSVMDTVNTTVLSKNVFPLTPPTPIIAHEFQIYPSAAARIWWKEAKWDFEPWPELDTGVSAWMDGGDPRAKFMQGCVIPLDTNGQDVYFTLTYEGGGTVQLGPFNTPAGQKTAVPFSYLTPFITHEWQLAPSAPVRCWYEEIKWIWEPVPELVTTYTTQPTDHDLPGYHYLFDGYIAYIGTGQAPGLTITTEYGSIFYFLPVSNGAYTRAYLKFYPQKAKWRSYSISCGTGVRLFLKDCEVRAKNWSDKGIYPAQFQSMHPFGDISRVAGALI